MGRHFSYRLAAMAGIASITVTLSACGAMGSSGGTQSDPHAIQSLATKAPERGDEVGMTLGLTYIPNVQFAAVYVAEDDAMYPAAGQITKIRHHGSDEGLFSALLSGTEDVVLASGDEALMARQQGMELVSVGTYYQGNPLTVLVKESSPIRSWNDLRGKRIGIPGEYGSSWIGLQAMVQAASLSMSDIEVVSIGYTQLAALSSDEVDAIVGFSNNEAVWFASAGTPVRALEKVELPLVSASLVTTRQRLDENPNGVCAVVRATEAGMKRASEVPQRAIEATQSRDQSLSDPQAVVGARSVLAATLELFKGADAQVSAKPDTAKWQQMLDFFTEAFDADFASVELSDVVSQRCFQH